MEFTILMTDGDWRLVRATSESLKPKPRQGRWVIVQHHCGSTGPNIRIYNTSEEFDDGEWIFCWYYLGQGSTRVCSGCETKVPSNITGFHDMVMWNNEEDMP